LPKLSDGIQHSVHPTSGIRPIKKGVNYAKASSLESFITFQPSTDNAHCWAARTQNPPYKADFFILEISGFDLEITCF